MSKYIIENKQLRISVSSYGAELMSIQTAQDSTEFLWQGDPSYWTRRALVMFPIVGSWPDDTYYVDSIEYKMPVNGFAKLSEFRAIEKESDRIVFELCSNDTTRSSYPYDFRLLVEYALEGSRLNVGFSVENTSGVEMPFAVGGHPGFSWPFFAGESSSDYFLRFEKAEEADVLDATGKIIPFLANETNIPVNHSMFENGALYLSELRSDWVELASSENPYTLRIYREQFPYLILWSQANEQASYLCIEPALSIGAKETSLYDRKGIVVLKTGTNYNCQYSIEINKK